MGSPDARAAVARQRRRLLFALFAGAAVVTLAAACKPSRSPRNIAEDDISGRWSAETRAPKGDTGRIAWTLELEQGAGGRMSGSGSASGMGNFELSGRRDAHRLVLEFRARGGSATLVASVESATRLAGEVELGRDTVPTTFSRR